MVEYKNHLNFVTLVLLFFLYHTGFIICQQSTNSCCIVHADMIFNSDYDIFCERPKNKIHPPLVSYPEDLFCSTIDLRFLKLTEILVDSFFVIDTIYYHSYDNEDNFKNYRRSFLYDKCYRISSILAEVYRGRGWLTHQITNVFYNSLNKVKQINHIRYQDLYDDTLIIKNEYDSENRIVREIRETLDSSNLSWKLSWKTNYNYEDGNLTGDFLERTKDFYLGKNYGVDIKYNLLNLPVEWVGYTLSNNSFLNDYKYTWEYNEQNLLSESRSFAGDDNNWKSSSNRYYKYDSNGNLVEESYEYFYDNDTSRGTEIYFYSLFLDSIKYTSSLDKNDSDSLVGKGSTTFEYDSCGYLVGYKILSLYKANESERGVKIKRDEYHNIVFIQEERWDNYKWFPEDYTKIIYKRKKF
jgi:hypothetical protein